MRACCCWLLLILVSLGANGQTFAQNALYAAQNGPLATASADFNGDGKLDIAVANSNSTSVQVFLGQGDGTFKAGASLSAPGCYAAGVLAGDFTGDGKPDVLAVCGFQGALWVFPGQGNGQFGAGISTTITQTFLMGFAEGSFKGLAEADFNGDGKLDLAVSLTDAALDTGWVAVMLGKGDGTFQPPVTLLSSYLCASVIAADMNGDGKPDLVVTGTQINSELNGASTGDSTLFVYLGDGKGGFQAAQTYALPGVAIVGQAVVADVNRDGIPDVVLVSGISNSSGGPPNSELMVFKGTGGGTLAAGFSVQESGLVMALLAADFRGTGTVDLVELNASDLISGQYSFYARPGNGDGTFQALVSVPTAGSLVPIWFGVTAGDWNGDGLADFAFLSLPSLLNVFNSQASSPLLPLGPGSLVVMLNTGTPPPLISVSSAQLQFSYALGASAPAAQAVTVSNGHKGPLNWTASTGASWLSVSPASGAAPGTVQVSVAPGLAANTYTGSVQFTAAGAANSPLKVPVTLMVVAPGTPVITAVQNGASFQPGIEAGSWVTIKGSNLSTSAGQTWSSSDIVNGNLPTALAGTSVTIDGKPAYTYYVSQSQINVQAPADSAVGAVNVVVTDNNVSSQPFQGTLQTAAPAFFQYPATPYAIATRYPDNALVGNPAAIPGTVAAKAGDVLILWATGFGPTSPSTPAGVVVTGAPAVATLPVVTVGGNAVPVISAVLSPGSVGLYQVAIQLPSGIATGVAAIQASVAGAQSPGGIDIFIGN